MSDHEFSVERATRGSFQDLLDLAPVLLMMALGLASCRSAPILPFEASVPDAFNRLHYDIPLDPDEAGAVLEDALAASVCLLRGGAAGDCKSRASYDACNVRNDSEIEATLEPFFDRILGLKLTSTSKVNRQLKTESPRVVPTRSVADARRSFACEEWRNADGACVAVRLDRAWFYLHAHPTENGGRPDRLEVFLAENVCSKSPTGNDGN